MVMDGIEKGGEGGGPAAAAAKQKEGEESRDLHRPVRG